MSEPRKDFGIQGLDEEDGYRTPGQGLADGHGQAKQPEHLTRCEHPGYTNPRVTHDERPLELADGGIGDTLTDESSSHRCGGVSGVGAEGIGNEVRRRADDEHGHYDIEKELGTAISMDWAWLRWLGCTRAMQSRASSTVHACRFARFASSRAARNSRGKRERMAMPAR